QFAEPGDNVVDGRPNGTDRRDQAANLALACHSNLLGKCQRLRRMLRSFLNGDADVADPLGSKRAAESLSAFSRSSRTADPYLPGVGRRVDAGESTFTSRFANALGDSGGFSRRGNIFNLYDVLLDHRRAIGPSRDRHSIRR